MLRNPVTVGSLLALVLLPGLILSCASDPGPAKNLLLITVDTLRPDRLGFSGHNRNTTPAIDQLAAESIRFETAYSQSGWTLPSIASILTGRYPKDHGAVQFNHSIDPELATLATILESAGYQTMAFVSHIVLNPEHGLADGFELYDASVLDVGHPHKVSTAVTLTDRVLDTIPSQESPFFLWVHYFDPHFDYMPHEEWNKWGSSQIDRYDSEIALVDQQIGRLLAGFEEGGLLENTAIVLTADHGESFGERSSWFHRTVFEEVIRIPLIIRAPRLEPADIQTPAQQIDILPTVLSLLGIQAPENLPGQDLLEGGGQPATVYVERHRPKPFTQHSVVDGQFKLIKVTAPAGANQYPARLREKSRQYNVWPGIYLYNIDKDPQELTNLYTADHPVATKLMGMLENHFEVLAEVESTVPIGSDTQRKLEALGYID